MNKPNVLTLNNIFGRSRKNLSKYFENINNKVLRGWYKTLKVKRVEQFL